MIIEMLETVMHGREQFKSGERRDVSDELGAYFCECGWAKDADGKVQTGERKLNEVVLTPDSVAHNVKSTEV